MKIIGYCKVCGQKLESYLDQIAPHHTRPMNYCTKKGQLRKSTEACPGSYEYLTFAVTVPVQPIDDRRLARKG